MQVSDLMLRFETNGIIKSLKRKFIFVHEFYTQMIKMKTEHYVVRCLMNGSDASNFIVDTRTGTLAITQRMVYAKPLIPFHWF